MATLVLHSQELFDVNALDLPAVDAMHLSLQDDTMALERYQTVFVGEDHNPDSLYMATLAHQRLYINSRECDQTEVTIWAEDGPSERGDGQVLYHREAPRIDEEPDEQGRSTPSAFLSFQKRDGRIRQLSSENIS